LNQKLVTIKNQIIELRKKRGIRAHIPKEVWEEIGQLSQDQPLSEICESIGIDTNHARLKINKLKNGLQLSPETNSPVNLIQLANSPSPILELNLANGTLIRVYSV
jgi:uncharacterized membrane-anchored protein YjiN (DUF445 family)